MKKVLIGILALIVLLLIAAVTVPIIFKDDIQKAIDTEMDNNLNAKVFYNTNRFSISIFKSFPNLTVSIGDFGITGVDTFDGDTLVAVEEFTLTLDIMSVISGDQIQIKNVSLVEPMIQILVLENGEANYDIAVDTGGDEISEENEEVNVESAPINIGIENWEIINGDVIYLDESLPFYTTIFGLNHQGSGDFSQDVFDMITETSVDELSLGYGGDEYLSDKRFGASLTMAMDLANMKFTFKDNRFNLNEFGFGMNGFISMPGEDIDMEINFEGKEIQMTSILSLIPGLYQEYLDGVSASGEIGFDGYVKGTFNEESMPQVAMNFLVDQGNISYAEYPIPIEDITIRAAFDYPSADLTESSFIVETFSMLIDGEKLTAGLIFKDFEDFFWDFKMDGNLDLGKITKIIPMEGMELAGQVNAKLQTAGRMSDLEAEKYDQLPTSGSMSIRNFSYLADDFPQGFGISQADASFNPSEIILASFKGNAGNTDLGMDGRIGNYLQYVLAGDVVSGELNFYSDLVDINEWMVPSEEEEEVIEEDTAALEVIMVPTNIDFALNSSIKQMLYDNLSIEDFAGSVIVRDGAVQMQGVEFSLLEGAFTMNGEYRTVEEENPTYSYDMSISDFSIPAAYQSFNTVQEMAPFAEKMTGKFSADFEIQGDLASDMMPIYETIFGKGSLLVAEGAINDVKLLAAASKVTPAAPSDGSVTLDNVKMNVEIIEGNVFVEPFDVKMAGYTTTISGSNSIGGTMDYVMTMKNVSTGAAGQAVSSALASLTGNNNLVSSEVDINMGVTGYFDDPKVKLLGVTPAGSGTTSTRQAATQMAKEKLQEQKKVAEEKVAEVKEEAAQKVEEAKEEVKEVVNEQKSEIKSTVKDKSKNAAKDAKSKLKGLTKKKKKGGGK